MQVRVPLTVRVRGHVHRDSIEVHRDVGAVIGVEPAQEDLIGLASALVLGEDQAGNDAKDVAGRAARPQEEVLVADDARARARERLLPFDDGLERRDTLPRCRRGDVAQPGRELEVDLVIQLHRYGHTVLRRRCESQLARRFQGGLVETVAGATRDLRVGHPAVARDDDLQQDRPGVFQYGSSPSFPTYFGSNYWVDVVYSAG